MQEENWTLQEDLFANMQTGVITTAYTKCWDTWGDTDYIPDYNKFYLIEDGEGYLEIGGRKYYPKPGQLFLMPAGVLQSFRTISSNTFRKYWCHFTAKIGDVNLFDIIDAPDYVEVKDFEHVRTLFQRLIREHDNAILYARLREKSALLEIIATYLELAGIHEFGLSGASAMEALNKGMSYIQEHIDEDLSVKELARRLHYHPSYFARLFKRYTGLTPIQYIHKTRLEKAKFLLKTTHLQVSEIAAKTGFCDIFYFSKSFKHYTGFSPTDYREI